MAKERLNRIIQVVRVSWIDSECIGEWSDLTELSHDLELIETVGMLIHSDKDVYLIASTYDGTRDAVNAAIWIPRACVRKVQPLGTVVIRTD